MSFYQSVGHKKLKNKKAKNKGKNIGYVPRLNWSREHAKISPASRDRRPKSLMVVFSGEKRNIHIR